MCKRVLFKLKTLSQSSFTLCSVVLGRGKYESKDQNLNNEDFALHH